MVREAARRSRQRKLVLVSKLLFTVIIFLTFWKT